MGGLVGGLVGVLKWLGCITVLSAVTACSTPRMDDYYIHRDLAIKDALDHCTASSEVLDNSSKRLVDGSTVRELALSYIDVKYALVKCLVVSEEVVALIGAGSES